MAGIHSIRKRVSHVKQTQKSVTKGMSTLYISEKASLETRVTKLRMALKQLEQDRDAWHSALKAERTTCEILASSVEETDSGKLLKTGVEKLDLANENLASVHDESFKGNVEKVSKHVAEMEGVLKEMRDVEGLLAEKGRYEKKVEKLVKHGQKEDGKKRGGKVERNVGKLKKAKEVFENQEKSVVEKAKKLNLEFVNTVEYLAKAFWGRRDAVLREFGEGSKELRMWATEDVKEEA